ncbi:CPBP family intramembrane metalloprotease [Geitlerinema splendidum]|nr:CPBP family intramembrane metalloprotease [Geitlerinema splendidum]
MEFIATISLMDFSHFLYFLLLIGAMASCWISKEQVTAAIALGAVGLGIWLTHIQPLGVINLTFMGVLIFAYYKFEGSLWIKQGFFLLIILLGFLFYEHMVPGFQNFILAKNIHLSVDSKAYQFYLNADKVLVALMLIIAGHPLNKNFRDWKETLRVLPLPFLGVSLILLGSAFLAHYIRFDFKVPAILWWWIPANLLLVCASEEIFFRGFIQNQLGQFLNTFSWGKWVSLGTASILFGLYHHAGGPIYMILATLAGVGYGYVYLKSQRIESSILLHFSVNLIHILAFSYPALIR